MKKRNHKNSKRRLTARERAHEVSEWWVNYACVLPAKVLEDRITLVLGSHARAALSRERARRGRGSR